jgi:hypothetical protein
VVRPIDDLVTNKALANPGLDPGDFIQRPYKTLTPCAENCPLLHLGFRRDRKASGAGWVCALAMQWYKCCNVFSGAQHLACPA